MTYEVVSSVWGGASTQTIEARSLLEAVRKASEELSVRSYAGYIVSVRQVDANAETHIKQFLAASDAPTSTRNCAPDCFPSTQPQAHDRASSRHDTGLRIIRASVWSLSPSGVIVTDTAEHPRQHEGGQTGSGHYPGALAGWQDDHHHCESLSGDFRLDCRVFRA
jgi:hypothetical protein